MGFIWLYIDREIGNVISLSHTVTAITVSLEQSDFTVTEGGDSILPINVVITEGSLEREVSISLFTSNITATAGMDYSYAPVASHVCVCV